MKQKYWIIIIAVIVAAVLLYFLLREPKPVESHSDDKSRLTAERDSFKVHEAAGLHKIDSLESASRRKDSIINQLKTEQAATRRALDKTTTTANRLAHEVKVLRKADTSELGRKCDSLAEEAMNFKFLYDQYKSYSDSITIQLDSAKADNIAAMAKQKELYNELKQKYDHVLEGYETIYNDLRTANRTIKRERLKTKIAALLGLIGGAAAVLK
jgi:hypothetical protein